MITLIMLFVSGVRGPWTGRFYLWGLMELTLELVLLYLWLAK
jgi:hypothetical protein